MTRIGALIMLGIVGCGGSGKKHTEEPEDPAAAARRKREAEIEAMKPESPYQVRETRTYQPTERCGQGPWKFDASSLKAKYGEKLRVYACGKHAMKGNYRMTTTRSYGSPSSDESAFGFSHDNDACKVKGGTVVAAGPGGGGGGGGTTGTPGKGGGGATSAAPATVEPRTLVAGEGIPKDCWKSSVIDMTWYSSEESVPLEGKIQLVVWTDEPSDLEGLVFVVEQWGVRTDMTREGWKAYRDADRAYWDAYRAHLDGLEKQGKVTYVDRKVTAPPPPPPRAEVKPPKPSKNARWIPGYWIYEQTKFHWIAGLWDVPAEDIQKELTVVAPTPPPAAPAAPEVPREPAPTVTAVWTPGSWQWDGRAYVWVTGAWRIPPAPQSTWQAPTWNVRRGRAVYVPGGWRIGIRLR
ncbi:MAG: YXWGXW repeat-containing protein [Myxococcales bacterium]|nr:YXWGXW repeat-containing protein [Myxococcales bacterium]